MQITTIGGGTGQFNLLSALRDSKEMKICAIVSMVDSGGSTGRLRDEFGILPPGDILKCLLALSPDRETARNLLQARFKKNKKLKGHNAGNMLLTILSRYVGNFYDGIKALGEILNVKGKVMPVTVSKATLAAELTDGSFLFGESAIDVPRGNQREKIKRTFLVPHHRECIEVYPPAVKAIKEAAYIIIGPGDLYTSIFPNFLVPGVKDALRKSKAKIIFVVNIMTKFGETNNYRGEDFVLSAEKIMGRKIDIILINNKKPTQKILKEYKKQKADFVSIKRENFWGGRKIEARDLIDTGGGIVRHNAVKLRDAIKEITK